MTHIWLRAEHRPHEARVGLTPKGAADLIAAGLQVTVEQSEQRAIDLQGYIDAGAQITPAHSWTQAPDDAIIFGLKELPDDGTPLRHRHIMFGHAFKGQHAGQELLRRFKAGGGALLDLEYLVDDTGRRLAAFGYWAGFAGAAVSLKAWAAQNHGNICSPVGAYPDQNALVQDLTADLDAIGRPRPSAIVIGALGRVGRGASDLCERLGVEVTKWDMKETAHGGPFPDILEHDLFFNCILAQKGVPQFVPVSALTAPRTLTVIGDVACDPDSDYNPVPVYDAPTTWAHPVLRVHSNPVLDVMAIDNLPSMLPIESSEDFAAQLLPVLLDLKTPDSKIWTRARATFDKHA